MVATCSGDVGRPERATDAAFFGRTEQLLAVGQLGAAMDGLCDRLAEVHGRMGRAEWSGFIRDAQVEPLFYVLQEEPLTRRAFLKPRGYAGDAVMMDYIYGIHRYNEAMAQATPLGWALQTWLRRRPACRAVQFRREHIAGLIDDLAAVKAQPDVLAIAAGHFREAECSSAIASGRVGHVVALDADAESVREVAARYSHYGVEAITGSVRDLIARKVSLGRFDFVYAAGLFDYLTDPTACALAGRMVELTRPGGQLLIPNFAPCCPDRAYLETFMEWNLIYRDEFDMAQLVEALPAAQIASYDIYSDPSGSIVYLLIRKAA